MNGQPPCLLLWTPLAGYRSALAAALGDLGDLGGAGVELVCAGSEAEAVATLARADAALLPGVQLAYTAALAQAVRQAPRLRWIQLIATGQEGIEQHGVPARLAVTGVGPTMAPVVAEHALALMLALVRRVAEAALQGSRAVWNRSAVAAGLGSLEGRTLCLVGYGRIGQETARRAQAFGMRCIGVNRSGSNEAPSLAQRVWPVARLHEALAEADVVALSLPSSKATDGLFGAAAWAACKRGALVVNVGRGSVIDTPSLVAALHSGHLAGAGLDVTDPEPLPDGHPLWTAPGALITPHVGGGGSPKSLQRLAALVRDNLVRFRAGLPLQHLVELPD